MKTNFVKIGICVFGLFIYSQTIAQQSIVSDDDKDAKQMIEKLDLNKDGKVSLEEAETANDGKIKKYFKDIDTNGDGFVVLDELKKFQEKQADEKKDPKKY